MKIYHGSKEILKEPKYKGSNEYNDYGPCFYVTTNKQDASIWACKHDSVGFVNEYELNINNLKILDLTDKSKYSVLNWIAILAKFRNFEYSFEKLNRPRIDKLIEKYFIDIDDFDLIIGYRADDAYFRFPKGFISGNLSVEDLEEVFKLGNFGIQYALVSEKAIKRIKFVSAKLASKEDIGKYHSQVLEATSLFDRILYKSVNSYSGTRIGDLLK